MKEARNQSPGLSHLLGSLEALMRGNRPKVGCSIIPLGQPGTSDQAYISYIQGAIERDVDTFYLVARTDHDFERAGLLAQTLCQEGKLIEIERTVIDPKKRKALVKRGITVPAVGIILECTPFLVQIN